MAKMTAIIVTALASLLAAVSASGQPGAFDVTDFGAQGDGVVNDAGAFQNALDAAAAASGGVVRVPAGDYLLEQGIVVPGGVSLVGVARHAATAGAEGSASRLLAGTSASALITLEDAGALEGVSIFYPNQTGAVEYPPAVLCQGSRTVMRWVHLVNPWVGLSYEPGSEGHLVRGATGQPLNVGVQGFPGGRLEAVAFKNDWNGGIAGGTAFEIAGPGAVEIFNCSASGVETGFLFNGAQTVLMTNVLVQAQATALRMGAANADSHISITNSLFQGRIDIDAEHAGTTAFTGCHFERTDGQGSIATLRGSGAAVFKACTFSRVGDVGTIDAVTVDVDPAEEGGAPLVVTSCVFDSPQDDTVHVRLSANVREAVIGANILTGDSVIENNAPPDADVQIGNNAAREVQP